jgi:hypothetical protein
VAGPPVLAPPPTRPTTLTLGFAGALLTGLLSAVGAILLIVEAHDFVKGLMGEVPDDSELGDVANAIVDAAASQLVARGVLGLVSAILVLAIALAVRNGALWARIVLTILLLGVISSGFIVVRDAAPAAVKALDYAAIGLSVLVVVLLFLPASGQYAKARKAAR